MSSFKLNEQTYNQQINRGSEYTQNGPEKFGEQAPRLKLVRMDRGFMSDTIERVKEDDKIIRVIPKDDPESFTLHKGDTLFRVVDETNPEANCIGTLSGVLVPTVPITVTDLAERQYLRRRAMEDKIELVGDVSTEVNGPEIQKGFKQVEKSAWRAGGHDSTINNGCFDIKKGDLLMKLPPILDDKGNLADAPVEHIAEWGDVQYVSGSKGGYYQHPGIRRPLILVPVRSTLIPKIKVIIGEVDNALVGITKDKFYDALIALTRGNLIAMATAATLASGNIADVGLETKAERAKEIGNIIELVNKKLNDTKYPKQHARSHLVYAVAESSAKPGQQFSIYTLEARV